MRNLLIATAVAAFAALPLAACEDEPDSVSEAVEESGEEIGEATEDAAEETAEGLEKATEGAND